MKTDVCAGVSLLTQLLYVAVFVTRYLDLFWVPPTYSIWNFFLKNFYIWSSLYIIFAMTRLFARTREREKAWRLGGYSFGASLIAAPLVTMTFRGWKGSHPTEMLWCFSIILESVCVLPQLLMLRETTVPTVIDSFYLVTLGSYRAFYILNWIVRGATEHSFDPIAVIFGVIQTAFYVDFAWVYYTRQRVKLRGGGIVDSEDLRKGFLVNKIIPDGRPSTDGDEEAAAVNETDSANRVPKPSRWGARGISVSADDTLDGHRHKQTDSTRKQQVNGSAQETAAMLDSDDDLFSDGEDGAEVVPQSTQPVLNAEQEWSDSANARSQLR
jgi:ER lumen protein retaining receptor